MKDPRFSAALAALIMLLHYLSNGERIICCEPVRLLLHWRRKEFHQFMPSEDLDLYLCSSNFTNNLAVAFCFQFHALCVIILLKLSQHFWECKAQQRAGALSINCTLSLTTRLNTAQKSCKGLVCGIRALGHSKHICIFCTKGKGGTNTFPSALPHCTFHVLMLQIFHALLKPNWNIPVKSKQKTKLIMKDSYIKVQVWRWRSAFSTSLKFSIPLFTILMSVTFPIPLAAWTLRVVYKSNLFQ